MAVLPFGMWDVGESFYEAVDLEDEEEDQYEEEDEDNKTQFKIECNDLERLALFLLFIWSKTSMVDNHLDHESVIRCPLYSVWWPPWNDLGFKKCPRMHFVKTWVSWIVLRIFRIHSKFLIFSHNFSIIWFLRLVVPYIPYIPYIPCIADSIKVLNSLTYWHCDASNGIKVKNLWAFSRIFIYKNTLQNCFLGRVLVFSVNISKLIVLQTTSVLLLSCNVFNEHWACFDLYHFNG